MIPKKVPIYGAYKGAYQWRKIFITVIRHLQRQKSGHPRHFFPFPVQVEKLVLLTAQFLLLAVKADNNFSFIGKIVCNISLTSMTQTTLHIYYR